MFSLNSSARYYNSDLSIWISVDPLSDKYPNLSPYVYCAGNPVRLVDPDGREIWIGGYKYTQGANCPKELTGDDAKAWHSLNSINEHKIGGKVVSALCDSKKKYMIETGYEGENPNYTANWNPSTGKRGGCGGTININNGVMDMNQILSHEVFHAYQDENGQYGRNIHNEVEAYMFEAIVCNGGIGRLGLRPDMKNDEYKDATIAFAQANWNILSQQGFDAMFYPIRNGFREYSMANLNGDYSDKNKCPDGFSNSNILKNLLLLQK